MPNKDVLAPASDNSPNALQMSVTTVSVTTFRLSEAAGKDLSAAEAITLPAEVNKKKTAAQASKRLNPSELRYKASIASVLAAIILFAKAIVDYMRGKE